VNLSLRLTGAFLALVLGAGLDAPRFARADDGGAMSSDSPNRNRAATRTARTLAESVAEVDALHLRRDDRGALAAEQTLVDSLVAAAPNDFAVLWRAARLAFWISDDPGLDTAKRSAVGKQGWELAERAIACGPDKVDGYYWAAVNIGNYALGLGIMKALANGLEGKFRARLERAEALDRRYQDGSIDVAWGRFYQKLPWPKRDRKKAAERFGHAIQEFPGHLRARVYLASLYEEDDKHAEAKRLLDEVLAAPSNSHDPAEERRAKALATGLLADVTKKLK